ncbi:hypothetical protein OIV83_003941 [Microbotryomycetes sp. JL201]|nr:hypothetical protein OIV83_003941 [Microbotryomycetes sp. JL201]
MSGPMRVVIDCDPGVDDVLAILLALSSPELIVVAIAPTHGNTTLECAYSNLIKLLHALDQHLAQYPDQVTRWPSLDPNWRHSHGHGPIQVYTGSAGPFDGTPITAAYFHGLDGLADVHTRHPSLTPSPHYRSTLFQEQSEPAHQALARHVDDNPPQSIAWVAIGPLTTLAHMHKRNAQTLPRLHRIFVMGGALDVPGNTLPSSEFNFAADPYAAAFVLSSGLTNLYLLPLDVTTSLTISFDDYKRLVDPELEGSHKPSCPEGKTPLVHFTTAFLEKTIEVIRKFGGEAMEMHDPSCVWALIDCALSDQLGKGWNWQWREFEVETTGAWTRGMLVVDRRASASSENKTKNRAMAVEDVEARETNVKHSTGARVVVATPGEHVLSKLLFDKIWNCTLD